jgi:hypothetical protein
LVLLGSDVRGTVEQRVAWDDPPELLKQEIESRTGSITSVRIASAGQNSPPAAVIDARDGTMFLKRLPSAHRRVITQAREAAVTPLVRDISPALLRQFDEAGWNVLGYEYAAGRHADLLPGLTGPRPAGAAHGYAKRNQSPERSRAAQANRRPLEALR